MIKKPETVNEIKALKHVLNITNYYQVSNTFLEEAYNFITKDTNNKINFGKSTIQFFNGSNVVEKFAVKCIKPNVVDGLVISTLVFTLLPHYNPSYSSGGGSSFGGGSSNNNHNNNNNNNNNH